jgi:hypothetical protein
MTPQELDAKWNQLSNRQASFSIPANIDSLVNTAINQWLDWYDGNYNAWPTNELAKYEQLYNQTNTTLEAAILQGGNTTYTAPTSKPGNVIQLEPVSIWGKLFKDKKKIAILGIASILTLIAASKVRT